jgi:CheY-like chemotaxis protein
VVSVKDEGIGISREMLPHIFEMFSQSKDATARSQGGLGIGLSLARGLVESHGGTIEAKSEGRGKGSEFIVRLPPSGGAALQSAGPEQPPVEGDRSYRLLVVDDLRDNADSLAALLKVMGHEVATAYDGEGAIRMAAEFMPEIILLDIGMPQMNGLDACRFIRTQSWGQDMLLVATTGWGQENDRRRTEEAGFDHHLVKPVHPEALTALLASLSDPLRSTPKP